MASPKAKQLGQAGEAALPTAIFSEHFHGALVHEVVRAEMAAKRRGTAATKTRGQVRGGGTKPWRQKGTGRARIGSIRAPHWTGGGTVFGPSPRSYTFKVNRKARRKALRAALSLHAEHGTVALLDGEQFKEPSTAQASSLLSDWGAERPTLVVVGEDEPTCTKSFRNIAAVEVIRADQLGVADLLRAHALVTTKAALDVIVHSAQDTQPKAERIKRALEVAEAG